MRLIFVFAIASFLSLFVTSSFAEDRESFYGTWGTEKQCSRKPIIEGGTFLAEPFEIGAEWLKHGQLWCSITWYPVGERENGTRFTNAHARCGEDSVRDYLMRFTLSDKNELTISWDLTTKKGPLNQCTTS